MRFFLVRHGEAAGDTFARPHPPVTGYLSEAGCAQAARAAGALADVPFSLVIASPYGRAIQTAEALRGDRDVPLWIVDDLHEWHPDRFFDAQDDAEREKIMADIAARHAGALWKTPRGEGTYDMYARIVPAFIETLDDFDIAAAHGGFIPDASRRDADIAVAAHGGTLNTLLSFILGVAPFPLTRFSFDLTGIAEIGFSEQNGIFYPYLVIPSRG